MAALDEVYDAAFPVSDPTDPVDVLAGPWPTTSRAAMAATLCDYPGWRYPPLGSLAAGAIAAADTRLLRLLVCTRIGQLDRDTTMAVLEALYASGGFDAEVVEHAFAQDHYLGQAIAELSVGDAATQAQRAPFVAALRDWFDAFTWRLTSPAAAGDWDSLPQVPVPRGLRFVRRALDWSGDVKVAGHLGAAELTDVERAALVEYLQGRPVEEQLHAFELRLPAGDAGMLLPMLGLADAVPLYRLIQTDATKVPVVRAELRATIFAAAERPGIEGTGRLLALVPDEVISAALGLNRAALIKRIKHNSLAGIAAFGLLPLAADETAVDRYLVLRAVAKRGAKLGPNRKHSHASAVAEALEHLALVAGFPDASRLEWDCEARIAAAAPDDWQLGDYTVAVRLRGADPVIAISKAGKALKSVPAAVRAEPRYAEVRQHQDRLREQAGRMRTGLIEGLVGSGGTLAPDELTRLRGLPSGAALLPALLWQDQADTIGLLDQVDTAGPLTAVHPFRLYERGVLGHWQAEIVRRRIRQPVKQRGPDDQRGAQQGVAARRGRKNHRPDDPVATRLTRAGRAGRAARHRHRLTHQNGCATVAAICPESVTLPLPRL